MRFAQLLYPYYLSSVALAVPAGMLFKSSTAAGDTTTADTTPINWWVAAGIYALFLIVIYLAMRKPKRVPSVVTAIASVLLVIFFIQYTIHEILVAHFGWAAVSLWFFGVGVATQVDLNISSWDLAKNLTNAEWVKTLFIILGALPVFASLYYPAFGFRVLQGRGLRARETKPFRMTTFTKKVGGRGGSAHPAGQSMNQKRLPADTRLLSVFVCRTTGRWKFGCVGYGPVPTERATPRKRISQSYRLPTNSSRGPSSARRSLPRDSSAECYTSAGRYRSVEAPRFVAHHPAAPL